MTEQKTDSTIRQKDVAFYSALVNGWIQTRMERDKTLASLSAGGIGLLVTILSTIGVRHRWEILLYCFAFLFFLVTIVVSVVIFDRNSKHIEDVVKNIASRDFVLKRLDKLSLCSFVFAALLSMAIGIVTATNKLYKKGGVEMSDKKKTENTTQEVPVRKSLHGIGNLSPQRIDESLDGIAKLRPQTESPSNQAGSPESASNSADLQAPAVGTDSSKQSE